MGKRKKSSRKPTGPKKRTPLATTFQCLFCNHENSVTVKMEKKAGVGNLSCKVCGVSFQEPINYLSAAVDVYAAWIDAAEDAAKEGRSVANGAGTVDSIGQTANTSYRDIDSSSRPKAKTREREDDGGLGYAADDFVVDDEEGREGNFEVGMDDDDD